MQKSAKALLSLSSLFAAFATHYHSRNGFFSPPEKQPSVPCCYRQSPSILVTSYLGCLHASTVICGKPAARMRNSSCPRGRWLQAIRKPAVLEKPLDGQRRRLLSPGNFSSRGDRIDMRVIRAKKGKKKKRGPAFFPSGCVRRVSSLRAQYEPKVWRPRY